MHSFVKNELSQCEYAMKNNAIAKKRLTEGFDRWAAE